MDSSGCCVAEEGALREGLVASQNCKKMQNYLREEENLLGDVCAVDNGSECCAGL